MATARLVRLCVAALLGTHLAGSGAVGAETFGLAVSTPATTKGDPFEIYTGGSLKSAVFDGLTQVALTGEVTPALALSWRAVNDTTWVFNLRPGVTFSDGTPVTAAGVAELLAFLRSAEARRYWMAQQWDGLAGARALDELTLKITTVKPDPLIPRRASLLRVIDLGTWRKKGETGFADAPVATGPYRVVSWGPNASAIKLAAVPGAWRAPKAVSAVEMKVITDGTRRIQALLSNEVQLAVNLDPDGLGPLEAAGLKTVVVPNPIVVGIALRTVNAAGSPLLDVRVRRALNYAVNKSVISEQIMQGLMPIASQGVTAGTVGHNPNIAPYPYDPDKARALLAEAGYPNGFSLVVGVWTGQVPGDALMFQQVAQDLGRVGVRAELRAIPFTDFSRRLLTGDWEGIAAVSLNWTARNMLDGWAAMEAFSCQRIPLAVFCDAEVDAALNLARHEMDPAVRDAKLQQAMAAAVAAAPSIFLVNYADIVAMRPDVQGYVVRSDGILFENITFAGE
ncbi:MAG: ABC transporter substrate-binding protein [Rhodospirillaceae bacterium]|nr:ABC transporter substrate-binding protein [Rhodospirillaceae bacterium]